MSETTLCIVIVAVTMVLFITRAFPMAVTAVLCSLAMGIMLPSVKLSAIYSGFGSAPVCMIAGMMIVGDAIFQTGVAQITLLYVNAIAYIDIHHYSYRFLTGSRLEVLSNCPKFGSPSFYYLSYR